LVVRIQELKDSLTVGHNLILEAEAILDRQLDVEMRRDLESLSSFEYLNDEKITQPKVQRQRRVLIVFAMTMEDLLRIQMIGILNPLVAENFFFEF
jgi:hypothetical protein